MKRNVDIAALQRMKGEGRKIVAVMVYDHQMARIVDRAAIDIVSVGDSVGTTIWAQANDTDVTLEQMILVCRAVSLGVGRAVVSCDFPYGPMQEGPAAALAAARRLVDEGGADLIKLDAAADHPEAVTALAEAGIPVWAQFGITPHTAARYGGMGTTAPELSAQFTDRFVDEAVRLERAGAALLDFTNSGPVAGPAATRAVAIPVIGGLGGGPWLDGRVRSALAATGALASALDDPRAERYADVAALTLDAIARYAEDVRAGRQIKGGLKVPPADGASDAHRSR